MIFNEAVQHVITGDGENRVPGDLFLKNSVLACDFTKFSILHQPLAVIHLDKTYKLFHTSLARHASHT